MKLSEPLSFTAAHAWSDVFIVLREFVPVSVGLPMPQANIAPESDGPSDGARRKIDEYRKPG